MLRVLRASSSLFLRVNFFYYKHEGLFAPDELIFCACACARIRSFVLARHNPFWQVSSVVLLVIFLRELWKSKSAGSCFSSWRLFFNRVQYSTHSFLLFKTAQKHPSMKKGQLKSQNLSRLE